MKFYYRLIKIEKQVNKEGMTNVNTIKEQINSVYKADIQAIRNLARISEQLQKRGLTIPGNLTVEGYIKCGHSVIKKNGEIHGRDLKTTNLTVDEDIKCGHSVIKKNGEIHGRDLKTTNLTVDENIKCGHSMIKKNGEIHGRYLKTTNLKVIDLAELKRLNILNYGRDQTHFNYANSGVNYLTGKIHYR